MVEIVKQIGNKKRKGNPSWRKGLSGNPNGRPPKPVCVTDILREIGAQVDPKTKRTKLVAACLECFEKAAHGDLDSLKFIVERTEGKVKDTLAIEKIDVPPIVLRLPTPEELQAIRGSDRPSGPA